MSADTELVIAIDIGTTSTKTLAVGLTGQILGSHSIEYPLHTPSPGYAEQDPDVICEAVIDSVSKVMRNGGFRAQDIRCVAFSSANHSLILLDSKGRPLTPSITWADQRSAAQAERLMNDGSGLSVYSRTGTPIHPMSPLVKLIWLREERPDLFHSAHHFVGIKEYILNKLFGIMIMDHSIASATGLFNLETLTWDKEALILAGIREDQLPRLVPSTECIEGLSRETAERMGLGTDTTFIVGAQDGVLANLGIGAVEDGVLAVTIGTSGAVRTSVSRPTFDAEGKLFCYALTKDHWIVGGPSNNGAIVARWISDRLYPGKPIDEVLPLAGAVPPGSDGLLFLPLLSGERAPFWDAQAKGVMFGLTLAHTEPDMLRAAMEGVLFQITAIVSLMKQAGEKPREVRASGGFARSTIWCQMMADMLGVPVRVPESVESSGLGAAQLGLHAMDGCRGPLLRWKEMEGSLYGPDLTNHKLYQRLLPLYLSLYDRLKEPMREISKLQHASVGCRN
ncbi:gluconokinase [Paenibacillus prosopidis]|uniref:Gluconate kinase (FGGY family) n=1 Tax=Paenibacillus prosopidis TaxID=630520 RepID=A0A368W2R7_9BACL|nr:gluconokinase [Paenibacillus prosopidis]RCW48373.1 gluconate kinase (FGGY family) [Paenibacillus prosopidis]